MTILLRFTAADLLRCRFATSPLAETVSAVRAFVDPRQRAYLGPWWDTVRHSPPDPVLTAVTPVNPLGAEVPDFLSPPPSGAAPRIEDQLAEVRAASVTHVAAELRRCRETQPDRAARIRIDGLLADPEAARHRMADELANAWRGLVLPWWPRIRELLDADVAHRSRLLAGRGLGHVVGGLDDRVRWADDTIVVRTRAEHDCGLAGRGLVFMPSAFIWPGIAAVLEPPWRPTLIYPARGIGELWRERGDPPTALARLLGRTRALLLDDLAEPLSTTTLAARHGLSPGGVSAHLAALHGAGLLVKRRHRHEVRYARTTLGDALATGILPQN